jgi:hypothetical protein
MNLCVADVLGSASAPILAVVDGARDRAIPGMIRASGFQHQSLYEGEAGEELAPFGPYLVALPAERGAIERWNREIWGKSYGVYLSCALPFDAVRKHLRRFIIVELESGRRAYFRFYDPRVLRTFLPGCTYEEWTQFFGPIDEYFMESEDTEAVLRFRRDADDPEPERINMMQVAQ